MLIYFKVPTIVDTREEIRMILEELLHQEVMFMLSRGLYIMQGIMY